jgi:predicted protein tyrosine phosphatase
MRVKALSRAEVETGGAEGADAVITIRPTAAGTESDLMLAPALSTRGECARLLKLVFDDVGVPTYGQLIGPTVDQVSNAIRFGRSIADGRNLFDGPAADPLIAVHCEFGRSRSAAIALALLADHFGAGNQRGAVSALMWADVEGQIHPNPLVISLVDACLFRYGRIDEALAEQSVRYVKWRDTWRAAARDPDAHRARVTKMLSGRRRSRKGIRSP